MDHVILKLELETGRFRLTGPLPGDANAGNRLYGEDFARWICEALPAWNLSCGDEDWGWEAFSTRGRAAGGENHRIGVYAYPADDQRDDHGLWTLRVHSQQKAKWLGLFTRWQYIPFDRRLGNELVAALRGLGVQDLRAAVVHLDSAGNERKEEPFA